MSIEIDAKTYRDIAHKMANRRIRGTPHGDLVKAIVQRLCLKPGILVIQHNTGALKAVGAKGRQRLLRYGYPGMADLYVRIRVDRMTATEVRTGVQPWRTLWLEVKVPGDDQRPSQAAFQKTMERCGDRYVLVESVDEAEVAVARCAVFSA